MLNKHNANAVYRTFWQKIAKRINSSLLFDKGKKQSIVIP